MCSAALVCLFDYVSVSNIRAYAKGYERIAKKFYEGV